MKNKTNSLLVIVLFAIAGAALATLLVTFGTRPLLVIASSSDKQPTPVEVSEISEP